MGKIERGKNIERYANDIIKSSGLFAIVHKKQFKNLILVILDNAYLDGKLDTLNSLTEGKK